MKKIFALTLIIFALSLQLPAKPVFTTSVNMDYSYDTNIFSKPLPQFDIEGNWLEWKSRYPFISKHSIGASINMTAFFNETDRTGLSISLNVKYPLKSTTITPVAKEPGNFRGEWEYIETNSIHEQKTAIFGGIGPIFKAQFKSIDVGCAIRLSLGGYDYIDNEVILGIQAEPFAHFYFSDNFFFELNLTYDGHLMRFINDPIYIFENNYQMGTLSPSLGIGFRF